MHDLNFTPDHPITLTLAADARLGPTDYTNDQIWEINVGNSEPPAISLQTTFGLRARFCRIFPRFIINEQVSSNPAQFHHPIVIHQYFPNYIRLSFRPFSHINVLIEYWVPGSQAIASRARIINLSREICHIQVEWAELLAPSADGNRMAIQEIGLATILAGQTSDLIPVLFIPGASQPGKSPYPSLNKAYSIPPHGEQETHWAHAALSEINNSYNLAKEMVDKNWDIEIARVSRINFQRLEIITGNHDWNNAFYLAQTLADQLFLQPTSACKSPSFVSIRNPDQGYSLLKDGSDYNHLWNGQTSFDTYYLMNFLIPASSYTLRGLLDNFLAAQGPEGEIDFKPGLGGQRRQLLATPLLASLARRYYEYTGDQEYIKKIFPSLTAFFYSWFTSLHDRDNDNIPEWDQVIQTGYDDHPLFSYINLLSPGIEISSVESPDLCSYLYQESRSLVFIAKIIEENNAIAQLENIADQLREMVEKSWDDHLACFMYRDRDLHLYAPAELLGKLEGSGVIEIHREFQQPIRPIILIRTKKEGTQPVQIYIHGTSPTGTHRVDRVQADRVHWHLGTGYFTSQYTYLSIEHIEAMGVAPDDQILVNTAGYTFLDQTLLLPLWAGIPSGDNAKILINLSIMNKKRYLCTTGIRSCVELDNGSELPDEFTRVYLPWNSMIVDGMLKYGERKKAAILFMRSMKAVVHSIDIDARFHQYYHSETGKPSGALNILSSLIPIGTFLNLVGVNIINSSKVEITGNNPFPWPVTIKYRGLTVVQHEKKTLVIFPDGQNITVDNNEAQIIEQTSGK